MSFSEFIKDLFPVLANEMDIDFLLFGKYLSSSNKIQSIVYDKDSKKFLPLIYSLNGTPCKVVTKEKACVYNENVAELFPEDALLTEMEIQGYAGVSHGSFEEGNIGVFVALTKKPITNEIVPRLEKYAERLALSLDSDGISVIDSSLYY